MAPGTPTTPASSTIAVQGSAPPTGAWRHPRFDEITRRQAASTFGELHAKNLFSTLVILFLTFVFPHMTPGILRNVVPPFLASIHVQPLYLIWLLRALLSVNGIAALTPLFRKKDDLADIPLTPSQRMLLGLDPIVAAAAPGTPGSDYVTPPRYARSTTPRSSDKQASYMRTGSPRSGSPLGMGKGFRDSSPFSPVASPLLQKAFGGGAAARRRDSFSGSQMTAVTGRELYESLGRDSNSTPGTPTPLGGGKGPTVALTNRWLYERGRRSPGHASPAGRVYG